MNFINSYLASESEPINLDHVVSFHKDSATETTYIVFETSSGNKIWWKYHGKKTHRDLDYDRLINVTRMPDKEYDN